MKINLKFHKGTELEQRRIAVINQVIKHIELENNISSSDWDVSVPKAAILFSCITKLDLEGFENSIEFDENVDFKGFLNK